jgi:hypothetical protein
MSESTRVGEALRAAVAGGHAAKLIGSATAIFQAGGNKLLSAAAQSTLRTAVEKGAEKAIATATGVLLPPDLSPMKLIGSGARATSAVVKGGARVAVREIAKGAGKAAGIGFVVDGAVATVEGVVAVRAGTMDKNEAMKHVAKEATTGAVATAAGVLLATGLVAITGGVAAPVVFAVGAIGSIGTKRALRRWVSPPKPILVTA